MISNIEIFQQSSTVVMRKIAGETLLVPINQTGADLHMVYVLNDTGAAVWEKLSKPLNLKQLAAELTEEYEASGETIYNEIVPLVQGLTSRGFLTVTYGLRDEQLPL